jgi:hypothetical protein
MYVNSIALTLTMAISKVAFWNLKMGFVKDEAVWALARQQGMVPSVDSDR